MRTGNANSDQIGVAYLRASTKRQGKSRLGIEVQECKVEEYKSLTGIKILRSYYEVKSGKRNSRVELGKALRYCRKTGARLLFAEIDRLARDALFVAMLLQSKVKVIALDKPNATILDLLEDAIRAEREGAIISQRTKAALQAAKKRGVILGVNGKALAQLNKLSALAFAEKLLPQIAEIREEGFHTIQAITNELNRRKIKTFRPGCKWHKSSVHKLLSRF